MTTYHASHAGLLGGGTCSFIPSLSGFLRLDTGREGAGCPLCSSEQSGRKSLPSWGFILVTDPQVHPQASTGWPPRAGLGQALEMKMPPHAPCPQRAHRPWGPRSPCRWGESREACVSPREHLAQSASHLWAPPLGQTSFPATGLLFKPGQPASQNGSSQQAPAGQSAEELSAISETRPSGKKPLLSLSQTNGGDRRAGPRLRGWRERPRNLSNQAGERREQALCLQGWNRTASRESRRSGTGQPSPEMPPPAWA